MPPDPLEACVLVILGMIDSLAGPSPGYFCRPWISYKLLGAMNWKLLWGGIGILNSPYKMKVLKPIEMHDQDTLIKQSP